MPRKFGRSSTVERVDVAHEAADADRGVVTFSSPVTRRECDQTWPLQPCEVP